jgi:uncharacterized metal-binding protein
MKRDPVPKKNSALKGLNRKAPQPAKRNAPQKAGKGNPLPDCGACGHPMNQRVCFSRDGSASRGCPTLTQEKLLASANREYAKPDVHEFARQASLQEAACYANRHERPYVMQPTKTRLVEICEFAERLGYRRLGLAFCIGLAGEAARVEEVLKTWGFEVVSAVCKAGKTSKALIGIRDEEKIFQGTDESMCNPVFQAELLNRAATQFNILVGLCVGHDSLFFKYAQAPTTVLAVKDRVTGHNPLAAIYLADTYYKKIKAPQ